MLDTYAYAVPGDITKPASPASRLLYVFDFDHTIVDKNSDTFVTSAISTKIPKAVKEYYDGTNWTAYMNKVMKFLASEGATVEIIQKQMEKLEFLPGMGELLSRIQASKIENPEAKLVILSDANDFFIQIVLGKLDPVVEPDFIVTNKAVVPESDTGTEGQIPYIQVLPFEDQAHCMICPKNLCKGAALQKYIEENGPFDKVYYTGDGRNDICPAQKLHTNDMVFARKGFAMEKCIRDGVLYHQKINIKAKIVYFENGSQIQEEIFQ